VKTAEAGALATGTTMEMELVGSTPEVLPNEALTALLDKSLREVGGVTYTAEERAFAATLQKTFMPVARARSKRPQPFGRHRSRCRWAPPMRQT
jgi:hypothetical protein